MRPMSIPIVREIFIAAVVNGIPSKTIAQTYGVTQTQVNRIKNGMRCADTTSDLRKKHLSEIVKNIRAERWVEVPGLIIST